MNLNDESESDSSESAGIALNLMSTGSAGHERMHPALQAQLLRAQQRRAGTPTALQAIQHPVEPPPVSLFSTQQPLMNAFPPPPPRNLLQPPTTAEETNLYDPFAAAGLDLQSERHNLNAMNEPITSVDSRRLLSTRQVHDEQFSVRQVQLKTLLLTIAKKRGLTGVSDGVCELVTFALQEHLENVIEQLVTISKKRMDEQKGLLPIQIISEPHQYIKRIQKFEESERRRLQQEERLRILEEAKIIRESQGKDEELDSKIAERVKKVEDEEKERQKLTDINDAALLAIGGGKEFSFKKKTAITLPPAPVSATHSEKFPTPSASTFLPASSLTLREGAMARQLTLQDCVHYLQRDYHTTKSNLLFKLYHRIGIARPRR